MKRRTTENRSHIFQQKLYSMINAHDLQGLTLNENRTKFTAGVEYFDLNHEEYRKIYEDQKLLYSNSMAGMLETDLIKAQLFLTNQLEVPLYYLWGYEKEYLLHEIKTDPNNDCLIRRWWINEEKVVSFWRKRKETKQTHSFVLNGAAVRANETKIDGILQANGMEWGGNIDGFILQRGEIVAIIDTISIGKRSQRITKDLNDPNADPALYFFKRGPRYESWLSTCLLANKLKVPHLLITLNQVDDSSETIGLTSIEKLTRSGVHYYNDVRPNQNVVVGIDNISEKIFDLISIAPIPKVDE